MLSIVTFKWAKPGYRSVFTAANVNTTKRMVDRHYPDPHRVICVTDDPVGIDSGVEVIPLWGDASHLPNPTWANGPSCYRRLKVFSNWFADKITSRFVVIDLDIVFTGDMRPIWNREEDFLIWRPNHRGVPLCASMFMIRPGTNQKVWDTFDHSISPKLASDAGWRGSDQGWITYCLGQNTPGWGSADGIYGYKDDLCKGKKKLPNIHLDSRLAAQRKQPERVYGSLPEDARAVIFTGKPDPWDREAINTSPWIAEHYR